MVRLWSLFLFVAVMGWPHVAGAKCRMPQAFFSVPTEQRVPPRPVVYLFTPPRFAPPGETPAPLEIEATDAKGVTLPVTIREATRTPAFEAFVVQAEATAPGEVTLRVSSDRPAMAATATVKVVTDFQAPEPSPVTIRKTETEAFFWTCSSQHSKNLTPSVLAPAYRVVWATSKAAFAAGKTKSFVVPSAMTGFFGVDAKSKAIVELGQSNCIGRTFDFQGRSVWVALQALHADGSETSLGAPRRVAPPR